MHYHRAACILTLVLASGLGARARADEIDDAPVREAIDEFYKALNEMFTGDVQPMLDAWSHADDVTYMGPAGGYQLGWDDVEASWRRQAAMKLGGQVEPEQSQLAVGRDLAVLTCYEKGMNSNVNGEARKVFIRATTTFRRENGAWKVIGHHTDLIEGL